MPNNKKINITTIGGGSGSYSLLSSIRDNEDYNLSAIISMSDNGGSTGVLREEFGILPPGDVRRGVMALSREHDLVKKLFDYRYDKECSVGGHSLGNLLITAMADITGSFDKGLKQISRMFKVRGKVIPVTLELSQLHVKLEDGQIIKGETNIDVPKHNSELKIEQAYLEPEVKANPSAIKAIEKSDLIIISHGDLYTSIIPNFLTKGISKAVKESNAKVVYFCNLMTKKGETNNFSVIDFVDTLEKYLGKDVLDYVVVNNGYISDNLAEKYKSIEGKSPVKIKNSDRDLLKDKSYKIIETDLLHENSYIRHSYDKIAGVIKKILKNI